MKKGEMKMSAYLIEAGFGLKQPTGAPTLDISSIATAIEATRNNDPAGVVVMEVFDFYPVEVRGHLELYRGRNSGMLQIAPLGFHLGSRGEIWIQGLIDGFAGDWPDDTLLVPNDPSTRGRYAPKKGQIILAGFYEEGGVIKGRIASYDYPLADGSIAQIVPDMGAESADAPFWDADAVLAPARFNAAPANLPF